MTSLLWSQFIRKLDREFSGAGRHILIVVDNASCHHIEEDPPLQAIEIIYLPPNTTSLIQPLDSGIIRSFKTKYIKRLARNQIAAIDRGLGAAQAVKQFDLLTALHFVKCAWGDVTEETIRHCFERAWGRAIGISAAREEAAAAAAEAAEDAEFGIPVGALPGDGEPCHGMLSAEEIAAVVRAEFGGVEEDEEEEDCAVQISPVVSKREALVSMAVIRRFLEEAGQPLAHFLRLQDQFDGLYTASAVQAHLESYFKRTVPDVPDRG